MTAKNYTANCAILRQFCANSFFKCLLFHFSGFVHNQKLLLDNTEKALKNKMLF
jgi:hypothetical protein